jgi:hypothetical protein
VQGEKKAKKTELMKEDSESENNSEDQQDINQCLYGGDIYLLGG